MMFELKSEEELSVLVEALDALSRKFAPDRVPGVGPVAWDRHDARKATIAESLIVRARLA